MSEKDEKETTPTGTLVGITPEALQTILGTLGTTSADAMKAAIRSQRKENPNYPERSVFDPRGKFNDEGAQLPPRVRLSRDTFFVGVKMSEESLLDAEIELFNRFTSEKTARDGQWKAVLVGDGSRQVLKVTLPVRNVDDRMGLPPLTNILRELLDGQDAVNTETLASRVKQLEAQLEALAKKAAA